MNIVITGCSGFIGSNLVNHLLAQGHSITGIDNLSTGQIKFIEHSFTHPKFKFIEGDLLNLSGLKSWISGADIIYHFAANADVRFGIEHPHKDLEQNTIATFNVLEAMRVNNIKKIVFSSTGSIYGEAQVIPTPENAPFPIQTSLYGASKLAGESLITAYCEGFGLQSWIFRFVSILGERYTHGHIFDFYNNLKKDPKRLKVLGNGKQRKSYLYIQDCLNAIQTALDKTSEKVNIFNLGVDSYCELNDSIGWICSELGVNPQLEYTGGDKGWIGDNPFIFLDTSKIRALGWSPKLNIKEGVIQTVRYLKENEWVFQARS